MSQSITSNAHGLHGLTKAIDASNLDLSNFAKLGTLIATSFVGTFGLLVCFFFQVKKEHQPLPMVHLQSILLFKVPLLVNQQKKMEKNEY